MTQANHNWTFLCVGSLFFSFPGVSLLAIVPFAAAVASTPCQYHHRRCLQLHQQPSPLLQCQHPHCHPDCGSDGSTVTAAWSAATTVAGLSPPHNCGMVAYFFSGVYTQPIIVAYWPVCQLPLGHCAIAITVPLKSCASTPIATVVTSIPWTLAAAAAPVPSPPPHLHQHPYSG